MFTKTTYRAGLVFLIAFLLISCQLLQPQGPQDQSGAISTAVAATMAAQPLPTLRPTFTAEPPQPTATILPTTSPSPTPTLTPTTTSTPIPCDRAAFVEDVTISDGELFLPEVDFTKTWRLKNTGSCTWTPDYDLVFMNGTRMESPSSVSLPDFVLPGETVDVSVRLTSPSEDGTYRGNFMLRNALGHWFGISENADQPIWAEIRVWVPCNWVGFVSDVNVADGTVFMPGVRFTKTWRLKNIGTCTWDEDYDLVYVDGNSMDAAQIVAIPTKVEPGEKVDLSIRLSAPDKPGSYKGYWMLRSDKGSRFGMGDEAQKPFWVSIKVVEPEGDYEYDFTLNYCMADWESGSGSLDCPGERGSRKGFVVFLDNPVLENRHEDEPALWVRPNKDNDGWIRAIYPAINISDGDHFRGWVGCLDDSKGCNVTFHLDYEVNEGMIKHLGSWTETYDGEITEINIDLSELAGQSIVFIFCVEVNNDRPEDADAFWFMPRIE